MNPKLTDQAVSDLPLSGARADLLEEIMSTPVLDETRPRSLDRPPRRVTRWVAPVAAAAAVAALATAPAWWPSDGGSPAPVPTPAPIAEGGPGPAGPTSGHLAVLEQAGWQVDYVYQDARYGGSISYRQGGQSLEVTWSPASSYAEYVEDREHILDPPAPGAPVEVLGADGQLWAYSRDDHTVIREVQDGHWMEFRAGGMDRAAYLRLLGELRLVDEAGFGEALPPSFVTDAERPREVERVLGEIEQVSGAAPPAGADPITSDQYDPYHLGADVAGGYACAWIAAYAGGDDRAQDVLATARDWPVLQRMSARGEYSQTVWALADQVVAGQVPEGYDGALGC